MGVGEDPELLDSISVTVIATGFNVDQQNEISNTEPEKIVHELEGDNLFSNVSDSNKSEINEEIGFENNDKIIHVLEEEVENEENFVNNKDENNEKIVHVLDEVHDDFSFEIENQISNSELIDKNENETDLNNQVDLNNEDPLNKEFNNESEIESSIELSLFNEKKK